MKMTEYKVVVAKGGMGLKNIAQNIEDIMNEMASDGWEYVNSIERAGTMLIFKKN